MATWYYVGSDQKRQGPVTGEALVQAYRNGALGRDSLVWREGLAQWSPLGDFIAELGIGAATGPGPVNAAAGTAAMASAPVDRDDIVYAGFLRRWLAFMIDSLILGFAFYAVFFVVMIVAAVGLVGSTGGDGADDEMLQIMMLCALLIYPVMSIAYFAGLESSRLQATIGKLALGIKVTDRGGRRLGFRHALGRWLASSLSYLTLCIGFFMAGFTQRKQGLHDMVAGTLVVDRWAYTEQPGRQQRELHGCLVAAVIGGLLLVALFVLAILAAIALPAYQDYVVRAKVATAMIEARAAQAQVSAFVANTDRCPRDAAELQLPAPTSPGAAAMEIGSLEDGRCAIELALEALPGAPELSGRRIILMSRDSDGRWSCSADLSQQKYLPADCR